MITLKSFDLARWRTGDEVMYRDGKEILDMHYYEHDGLIFPIHALAWDGSFTSHLPNGSFDKRDTEHPRDIVMKPKKVKYYFASWDISLENTRGTSGLFINKRVVEDFIKAISCTNTLIHEIEIEE